jgi:hypothetical protein
MDFEEQKRRLWALTRAERVEAKRAGRLSLRLCLHWASLARHEGPTLNDEFEFIAHLTPEATDATDATTQRERVTASLLRRPVRRQTHHD